MNSKKIDQTLLVIGALLAAFSGYLLFFGSSLGDTQNILGELTSTYSVVKTKNPNSLDWRDAGKGNLLGNNQLIFTDTDSSAEVSFLSGDKLSIASSALVRIRDRSGVNGLDVKKGTIRTKLTSGTPLSIGFNGKDYLMQGDAADIQVNLSGGAGEIGVVSGEVSLMAGDRSIRLNERTALEISEEGIKETAITFKTETPMPGEEFYVDAPTSQVIFQWEPKTQASLQIASDPAFKDVKTLSTNSGHAEQVPPGLWYWKVKDSSGSSLTGSFKVQKEVPLVILRPKLGDSISVPAAVDGTAQVLLQWKAASDNYQIEYRDQTGTKTVESKTHSLALPIRSSGPLSWRVKIANSKRPQALWSEWQATTINVIPYPVLPTELFPHEVEFQSFHKESIEVELNWKSEGKVALELQAPDGKSLQETSDQRYYKARLETPGKYSWRVRAQDSEGREGEWTEWKNFTIEDLSNEKNAEGVQRIQLTRPDQEVTFAWDSESGSTDVFELSADKKFDNVIIKKELTSKSTKVNIPKVGTYYWRSRQFQQDGKITVSEPVRVIIEPAPAPSKPEKAPDVEVPLEWKENTPKSTWMDFFISPAHADDLTGIARFWIPPNENAKSYIIRVYADEELREMVLEKKIDVTAFEWEGARPGRYFWQYAIVDHWDRTSPFSDAAILTVKDTPLIHQPKLISPIRAVEIENESITLNWSEAGKNTEYLVEISDDSDFAKPIVSEKTAATSFKIDKSLESKLHFWRISATKNTATVVSNTGRFVVTPKPAVPTDEASSARTEWRKKFNSRLSLAWVPSMDTYDFEDGEKGSIDGTAMNGVELKGSWFEGRYVFGAEILRQSGQVYESEEYLFQRILGTVLYSFDFTKSKLAVGLSIGQSTGSTYSIEDDVVSGSSISGINYGPTVMYFHPWNERWEFQGRVSYLLGEIKQWDVLGEVIHHRSNFFYLVGAGMSNRQYELSSGEQASLRVSVGLGKEF